MTAIAVIEIWPHISYQLPQFVLKIGFALAERVRLEEVGGCHPLGDSAWRLLQLAVEKPWSVVGGLLFCTKGCREG